MRADGRVTLRALGWDHPRCLGPMRACASEWERTHGVRVEWHARSLEAFGDQPLEALASAYDLLVIDHPMCGTAASAGCLRPLEEILGAPALEAVRNDAVGASQRSYDYGGQVWALAVDAACQVTAIRDGAIDPGAITDWSGAMELIERLGPRSAIPLAPAHSISSLLTLWASAGLEPAAGGRLIDPDRGLEQVLWLQEAHRRGHVDAARWEPPQALAAIEVGELDFVPLTYGYVTYSRPGGVRFLDIPGVRGSVLGGAGIAVSARSRYPRSAAVFAAWTCSAEAQTMFVAPFGGQPAAAACWHDDAIDRAAGGFYSATRATIERSWTRPREPWWPPFQLQAGRALTAALEAGEPGERILDRLCEIHDGLRSIHDTTAPRSGARR